MDPILTSDLDKVLQIRRDFALSQLTTCTGRGEDEPAFPAFPGPLTLSRARKAVSSTPHGWKSLANRRLV